jgi:hypothetical protein
MKKPVGASRRAFLWQRERVLDEAFAFRRIRARLGLSVGAGAAAAEYRGEIRLFP